MTSVPTDMPTPFGKLLYPKTRLYADVRSPDTGEVIGRVPVPLPRPRWDITRVHHHPCTDSPLCTHYAVSVDNPNDVADCEPDTHLTDRWLLAEIRDNCYCPQMWAKVPF